MHHTSHSTFTPRVFTARLPRLIAMVVLLTTLACHEAPEIIEVPNPVEPTRVFVELNLERFDEDIRRIADTMATGRAIQEYIETEAARPFRARVENGLRYSTVFSRVYDPQLPIKVFADAGGLNERGLQILDVLDNAELHVLDKSPYHIQRVRALDAKLKASDNDLHWEPIVLAPKEAEALIQWLERKNLDPEKPEIWTMILETISRFPGNESLNRDSPLPRLTAQIEAFLDAYTPKAQLVAELELRLADGALRFARDMKHHNLNRYDWRDLRDAGGSTEVILARLEKTYHDLASTSLDDLNRVFEDLEPRHPQYRKLLAARARYQAIVDAGGWPHVRSFDVELGARHPRVPDLRERLRIEGYLGEEPTSSPEQPPEIIPAEAPENDLAQLPRADLDDAFATEEEFDPTQLDPTPEAPVLDRPPTLPDPVIEKKALVDPTIVDQALFDAVKLYQETHQFRANGKPGPQDWRSINVSAERRLAQIELSISRWRDTFYDGEADYVFVNVPDFHAEVYADHELQMRFKVVVGNNNRVCDAKTKKWNYPNATPVQMANMDHMIINPSWYVPTRLVEESLKPNMKRDPNWFENNGYEEIKMPGGRTAVRQKPGENNALGLVKFIFPNPHNTYMHDTPQKHYFNFPTRAYSFGCVRVHTPLDFARFLLEFDDKTENIDFDALLESGQSRMVRFERPLPVFTEYYTVRVDSEGHAHFLADIYRYDERDMSEDPDAWGTCTPGTRRRADSADGSSEAPAGVGTDLGP